ncbi:MAG: hypothetical protein ABI873_05330 [Marmoricola sp.]
MTESTTGADHVLPAIGSAVDKAVAAIDGVVPVERSSANNVLEDRSREMPWIGVVFAVCAVLTIPWVFYIGLTLPQRQLSPNYDIAWAGFDVFLFVELAFTAYAVLRRSPWVAMCAGAAAALLVTDVWFDVVTAPDKRGLLQASAMALVVELPLAAVCVWLCRHAKELADRRIGILLHRERVRAEAGP